MSEELFPETELLPAVAVFYGGEGRGRCIQLTKREEEGVQFITIRAEDIPPMVERLRKVAGLLGKGAEKTCSDCRYWDWYYCDLNTQDESGRIEANYGHCAVTGDLNIGKDTPACGHFELSKKVLEGAAAGGSNAASKPEAPQPTKLCKGVGRPQTSNRRRLALGQERWGGGEG